MGLSNSVHWCSWFITSMLQMSLTSTMLVAILFFGEISRNIISSLSFIPSVLSYSYSSVSLFH